MKRLIFNALRKWRDNPDRKPLILQGARQVGKTYLLRTFAKTEFERCAYVNFEEHRQAVQIFERDLKPSRIIQALETYLEMKIDPKNTLIFFDEIQLCSNALNSLKYFCEEARDYAVVSAGSLLGVALSNTAGFPVGQVNFLEIFPMTFLEFLEALGKKQLLDYVRGIQNVSPLEAVIHDTLCEFFKAYLYVGGMPEAVKTYVEKQDFSAVRRVHEEILKAYALDFSKHATVQDILKINEIWRSLPSQLAKENKKFIYSAVKSGARAREYGLALQWLISAGLVYPSHQITVPKLPLNAYEDGNAYKLYCLDVGILGALADLDAKILLEKNALFTEFKGALTENSVAQLLKSSGVKQLFYWSSQNTAEVDFIIPHHNKIFPVEVKSGLSNKKKSLQVYDQKYHPDLLYRISPMNLKHDGRVCNYPVYLTELWMAYSAK